MQIDFFSDRVHGLMISANDFEFYLSSRLFTALAIIGGLVAVLRIVKKVRDAR